MFEQIKASFFVLFSLGLIGFYIAWPYIEYFQDGNGKAQPPLYLIILGALSFIHGANLFRISNNRE